MLFKLQIFTFQFDPFALFCICFFMCYGICLKIFQSLVSFILHFFLTYVSSWWIKLDTRMFFWLPGANSDRTVTDPSWHIFRGCLPGMLVPRWTPCTFHCEINNHGREIRNSLQLARTDTCVCQNVFPVSCTSCLHVDAVCQCSILHISLYDLPQNSVIR